MPAPIDSPRTFRVLPVADRVEDELLLRAREGAGVALGADLLTFGELERRLLAAAGLEPISELAARLLAARVCGVAARGTSFEPVATEPGFASAFLGARKALRAAGLGPSLLEELAGKTTGLSRRRLSGLAQIAAAYESELARLELTDEALALALLPGHIERGRVPVALRGATLVIEDVLDFNPARCGILAALARAGTEVRVLLAGLSSRPGLAAVLEPLHRSLELDAPGVKVEEKAVGGGALAGFHRRLFDPTLPASPDPVLLIEAGDENAELRAAVRVVRGKLASGVPADDIVVAARGMASRREHLGQALGRAGIPWRDRRGSPALEAPPVALTLSLLASAERHHPRDSLARILTSRYVESPEGEPFLSGRRIAELLREAASRDDGGEGHPARLRAHARRLGASATSESGAARARTAERAADRLEALLPALRLPSSATLDAHASALEGAVRALGIERRLMTMEDGGPAGVDAVAAAALARDVRAFAQITAALGAIREAAARTRSTQAVPLFTFHGLLAMALGQATVRARGSRGGAVRLCDVSELPGRSVPHLVLMGLWDGGFPGRSPAEPLLDTPDRETLNAAAGHPVLRARSDEPLLFALACLSAQGSLTLTRPCHDAEGRELLASPFFDEARGSSGIAPNSEPGSILPTLDRASWPGEAAARVGSLLAGAAPAEGEPLLLASVRSLLEVRALGARTLALSAFPGPGRLPGAGRLLTPGAQSQVDAWLSRRADSPGIVWVTSVSTLEDYASCPFKLLGKRILDLGEPSPADDDLDLREGGTLLHELARAVFEALGRARLLPLAGGARAPQEQQVVREACESALRDHETRNRTGPDPFWAVRREAAVESLLRLVEVETREGAGAVPLALEAVFGEEGEPPLLLPSPDGKAAIAVRGRIDRVDQLPGGLRVIDYKSGYVTNRLEGDEQGRTAFQLPIYALWARQKWGGPSVDGAYRSFRDGASSRGLTHFGDGQLDLDLLWELDPGARRTARGAEGVGPAAGALGLPEVEPNLADAAWAFWASMREGRFPVAPVEGACRFCALATVCRVDRHGGPA